MDRGNSSSGVISHVLTADVDGKLYREKPTMNLSVLFSLSFQLCETICDHLAANHALKGFVDPTIGKLWASPHCPGVGAPPFGLSAPPFGLSAPPFGHSAPPFGHSAPPFGHSAPPFGLSAPPFGLSAPPFGLRAPPLSNKYGSNGSIMIFI